MHVTFEINRMCGPSRMSSVCRSPRRSRRSGPSRACTTRRSWAGLMCSGAKSRRLVIGRRAWHRRASGGSHACLPTLASVVGDATAPPRGLAARPGSVGSLTVWRPPSNCTARLRLLHRNRCWRRRGGRLVPSPRTPPMPPPLSLLLEHRGDAGPAAARAPPLTPPWRERKRHLD